jgi:hypothetical protein
VGSGASARAVDCSRPGSPQPRGARVEAREEVVHAHRVSSVTGATRPRTAPLDHRQKDLGAQVPVLSREHRRAGRATVPRAAQGGFDLALEGVDVVGQPHLGRARRHLGQRRGHHRAPRREIFS